MIDHTGLTVSDVTKSREFYRDALAPLGYTLLVQLGDDAGFGVAPKPDFWIGQGTLKGSRSHVAFRAETRQLVDAFYEAAMAAGATDNGPPGIRTITRTTTARLCSIRTDTTSRRCVMPLPEHRMPMEDRVP